MVVDSEHLADAVWGAAIGDALGVPYEFKRRGTFTCTDMVGYGTHRQPAGTWSDDTAMMLATCDSLRACQGVNKTDLLMRFRSWAKRGAYTPDGVVFDIGNTVATALALGFGQDDLYSNGNGSLMRIAPLAFCGATDGEIRIASAVTHAHELSMNACVMFVHMLRKAAYDVDALRDNLMLEFGGIPRDQIKSGGFVSDTFRSALWCFVHTSTYVDCVLEAVNLGSDTDTTACVAGALAGVAYGRDTIPQKWIDTLRGKDVLESVLF